MSWIGPALDNLYTVYLKLYLDVYDMTVNDQYKVCGWLVSYYTNKTNSFTIPS
jgi:hypothetical protein